MGKIVLGLDIETTGLDHAKDQITEIAWIVQEIGNPKPYAMQSHFIQPPPGFGADYISPEIYELTKITVAHVTSGVTLGTALSMLYEDMLDHSVDFIVAHNGENFDKPFITGKAKAMPHTANQIDAINLTPWIDTAVDCVYPPSCRYTNLMYVAAHFGILNPFPHSALFDVATMLKVLHHFDFDVVVARSREPWVFLQAVVSFDDKARAKERRYNWETIGDRTFSRKWVKKVKSSEVKKETEQAPFRVNIL